MFAVRSLLLVCAALVVTSSASRAAIAIECTVAGGPTGVRADATYSGIPAADVQKVTIDYYLWDGAGYNTLVDGFATQESQPNEVITDIIAPGNRNFAKFVKDKRYRCVVTVWGKAKPPAMGLIPLASEAFDFVMQ
jgi:hypothetical protein